MGKKLIDKFLFYGLIEMLVYYRKFIIIIFLISIVF